MHRNAQCEHHINKSVSPCTNVPVVSTAHWLRLNPGFHGQQRRHSNRTPVSNIYSQMRQCCVQLPTRHKTFGAAVQLLLVRRTAEGLGWLNRCGERIGFMNHGSEEWARTRRRVPSGASVERADRCPISIMMLIP